MTSRRRDFLWLIFITMYIKKSHQDFLCLVEKSRKSIVFSQYFIQLILSSSPQFMDFHKEMIYFSVGLNCPFNHHFEQLSHQARNYPGSTLHFRLFLLYSSLPSTPTPNKSINSNRFNSQSWTCLGQLTVGIKAK